MQFSRSPVRFLVALGCSLPLLLFAGYWAVILLGSVVLGLGLTAGFSHILFFLSGFIVAVAKPVLQLKFTALSSSVCVVLMIVFAAIGAFEPIFGVTVPLVAYIFIMAGFLTGFGCGFAFGLFPAILADKKE